MKKIIFAIVMVLLVATFMLSMDTFTQSTDKAVQPTDKATHSVDGDDEGFSFDDLAEVELGEQQIMLQMAKEAANNYDFSEAQSLIEQAQYKGYAPDAVNNAKQVLASAKDRKQSEDAEAARRAEEKRQRELAAQRQQSSGGDSSSGGMVDFVIVIGQADGFMTLMKNIKLSGGPGYIYSNTSPSTVNINKGYNGKITGTYQYSSSLRLYNGVNKVCSGSVYIDGRYKWATIYVGDDCQARISQQN